MHTANMYYLNSHLHSNNKRKREIDLNYTEWPFYSDLHNSQPSNCTSWKYNIANSREKKKKRAICFYWLRCLSFVCLQLKSNKLQAQKKNRNTLRLPFVVDYHCHFCTVRVCRVRDLNSIRCCSCNQTYTHREQRTHLFPQYLLFFFSSHWAKLLFTFRKAFLLLENIAITWNFWMQRIYRTK